MVLKLAEQRTLVLLPRKKQYLQGCTFWGNELSVGKLYHLVCLQIHVTLLGNVSVPPSSTCTICFQGVLPGHRGPFLCGHVIPEPPQNL